MKKILHYADCLMLLAAIIGCLLRLWFGNSGLDSRGLFQPEHPAWILLCLLSAGVAVFNFFVTRNPGDNQNHSDNFPRSVVGAVGCLLLAAGMGYSSIAQLLKVEKVLDGITAIVGVSSAVCLSMAGVKRVRGQQPAFFVHMIPCVFVTLQLCLLCRELGTDPELCGFLFRFLASLFMIPALFWRWAFDMEMGNRRKSLFFSLCAMYFCLVTTFEVGSGWLMYLLYAAFLMTNLCSLRYLPAAAEESGEEMAAEPEEVAEQAAEAVAEVRQLPADQPQAPMAAEQAVLHSDIDADADIDAFLADIKQYLDDQGY